MAGALALTALLGAKIFLQLGGDQTLYLMRLQAISGVAVVILALATLAWSIKEPDIKIFLGDKTVTNAGTLIELRIVNKGNAIGNMASVFVEIGVAATDSI